MRDVPCFIGIDVAKAQLDIAIRPSGERWAVPNDAGDIMTLVERLQALHPALARIFHKKGQTSSKSLIE